MLDSDRIREELTRLIWLIEHRPGMVFSRNYYTYPELSSYINGIFHAIESFSDISLGRNFSNLVNNQCKTPVVWDALIEMKAEKLDANPSELLLQELKLFIENGQFSVFEND